MLKLSVNVLGTTLVTTAQYSEWTAEPVSTATLRPTFTQFTGSQKMHLTGSDNHNDMRNALMFIHYILSH